MKSIINILPLELENRHIDFIKEHYIFLQEIPENLVKKCLIKKIDEDLTLRMQSLQGINMENATNEQINNMKMLIKNLLFINNIDYNDLTKLNYRVRGIEKWLKIKDKYGTGGEGTVYKINIKFNDLVSPDLAMKRNNNGSGPTELLKEFLNYYLIGYLKEFTPNFIEAFSLVTCNTSKYFEIGEAPVNLNSPMLCSCVGTLHCNQKNYMITKPFKGDTFEKISVPENQRIVNDNLKNILLQIIYSLKIAQEKLKFLHNDLNAKNVSLSHYDEPKTLTYIFSDGTSKEIISNVKVNIFDFGGSDIKDFIFLETKDKNASDEYKRLFKNNNVVGDLIKEYFLQQHSLSPYDEKIKKIYLLSNTFKDTETTFEDAVEYGMVNDIFLQEGLVSNFGQEVADYVNNRETDFNETADIKNFIRIIITYCKYEGPLKSKLQEIHNRISSINTINKIIIYIESLNLTGGSNMHADILKTTLESFKLQDITQIHDPVNGIDIDGYISSLYGAEPKFSYEDIAKDIDFYNLYGDIKNNECINSSSKTKQIYWGNPGYTKFTPDEYPLNWEDAKPSELVPVPVENGEKTSFTYSFVIDKYTKNISVRYGRITNVTEIGANHAIISYADKIIVSGEIAVVKENNEIVYYINNNSSKMTPVNSNINLINNRPHHENSDTFYYILIINLALKLFRALDPENSSKINISKNIKIKYGDGGYNMRKYTGDDIVDYYTSKICPTDSFISKFNEFGETNKIMNACIGFKNGDEIENMHTIKIKNNDIIKCKWDNEDLKDKYYLKYSKYKNKYLKLLKKSNKL